jgi:hypothetical protein
MERIITYPTADDFGDLGEEIFANHTNSSNRRADQTQSFAPSIRTAKCKLHPKQPSATFSSQYPTTQELSSPTGKADSKASS